MQENISSENLEDFRSDVDEEMNNYGTTARDDEIDSESSLLQDIKALRMIVSEALSSTKIKKVSKLQKDELKVTPSFCNEYKNHRYSGSRRKSNNEPITIGKSTHGKPPKFPPKDSQGEVFISSSRDYKKIEIPAFERLYELGKRRLQLRGN